jgi:hypothetical protein
MAKYLILIYGQESGAPATPEQWDWMMQAHGRFTQAVAEQGGKILGGEALQPTATATSIRSDGQTVTSGPFVAAKEALGGFYLLEAADSSRPWRCRLSCLDRVGGQEARQVIAVCLPVPSVEADRVGVQVGRAGVVVDEEMVEQLLPVLEKGLPGVQIRADALDGSQAFIDRAVKDGQRELVEQVWGHGPFVGHMVLRSFRRARPG